METAIDRRDAEAPTGKDLGSDPTPARSKRVGLSPEAVRRLSELSPLRATLSLVETWGTITPPAPRWLRSGRAGSCSRTR